MSPQIGRPVSKNPKTANLSGVRCTPDELSGLHEAALADNPDVTFSEWVRSVLFGRATEVFDRQKKRRRAK